MIEFCTSCWCGVENSGEVRVPLVCCLSVWPCRHAGFRGSLLIVVAPLNPKKVRLPVAASHFSLSLRDNGGFREGQAVPSGIRQERPRIVQEMQRKHRERFAEDGHHGAGDVAAESVHVRIAALLTS